MSKFLFIICAWSTILLLVLTEFPFEFSGIWKVCINLLTHWYCRYCSPDRGINGICAASNILSRRWRGWGQNWNFVCSDKYDYNSFTFKPLSVDITIHKIILIVMIVDGQYRWPVQRQLECHVAAEQTQRNWTQPSLATTHNWTGNLFLIVHCAFCNFVINYADLLLFDLNVLLKSMLILERANGVNARICKWWKCTNMAQKKHNIGHF